MQQGEYPVHQSYIKHEFISTIPNNDVMTIMLFDTFQATIRNALIVRYRSKLIIQFSPIASRWRFTMFSSLVPQLQGLGQAMLLKMKPKLTVQFLHSKFWFGKPQV